MEKIKETSVKESQEPKKDLAWLKKQILSIVADSNVFLHTFAELVTNQIEADERSDQSKIDFQAFFNQVVSTHLDCMDKKVEEIFKEFKGEGGDN